MDSEAVGTFFGEYLDMLAACARGDEGRGALLAYCGIPMLLTGDDSFGVLGTEDDVLMFVEQQIKNMRADEYDHSEVVDAATTTLNRTSALHRATLSRKRKDGEEIGRLTVTYLITVGPVGPRISALALHPAAER